MKYPLIGDDNYLCEGSYVEVRGIDGAAKELSVKCTNKTPIGIRVVTRWNVR